MAQEVWPTVDLKEIIIGMWSKLDAGIAMRRAALVRHDFTTTLDGCFPHLHERRPLKPVSLVFYLCLRVHHFC